MRRSNPLHPGRLGGFLTAQRRPGLMYAVSFLIPFAVMGAIWAICGVGFGNNMILPSLPLYKITKTEKS